MPFSQDLFISYAHLDNEPVAPEPEGWITRFHASLEALLSMRMGGKARVWRDDRLRGNDDYSDEIVGQFAETAVLVSVLTPRYLNSIWCTKEVAEFCEKAEESGGLKIENKYRLFKVIKTPVDTEESLPPVMKNALGFEFFIIEDDAPLELDKAYGEKFGQEYNKKVGKLAHEISQLLKKLARETREGVEGEPATAKATIYLAECSYDRKEARETLETELKVLGYTVLPDQRLPQDEEQYVAEVKRLLERCTLAIHLVGESAGAVPDGPSQKPVVVLQNELAVQRSKSGALRRVIWLPEGTHSERAPQQEFIDALHGDHELQFAADLVTGGVEDLRKATHAALEKLENPEPKHPSQGAAVEGGTKLIYLICDERDRKATVPLRKFCREQGLEVALPAFEGNANAVRKANQQLLTTCDGVIVFYGAGDEAWKRTIDSELKKTPGYRGGLPLLASQTYLAAPKTGDKEDLIDVEEPHLIDGLEGFSGAQMAEFVEAMQAKGAAS